MSVKNNQILAMDMDKPKPNNERSETTPFPPSSFRSLRSVVRHSVPRVLSGDFTYSWKNLSVEAIVAKTGKCCARSGIKAEIPILRKVSGVMRSGELWCLMGASGAGKTSLLNSLTFRSKNVKVTGERCINGVGINAETISAVSGYVQQDDLLPGFLTCREHLAFTAALRLPRQMTRKEKASRVDEVLQEVGLWHVRNVYIGGIFKKGISGGEKKRLAFGSEILTDPSILFCDEPTSGLDSFMARVVVDTMKDMASRGKLVICTIHQPSTEVFRYFDHLYLLTEGRLAFGGPRQDALTFFAEAGYVCPATYNPADFYIKTLAIVPDQAKECRKKAAKIAESYLASPQCLKMQSTLAQLNKEAGNFREKIKGMKKSHKYEANPCKQTLVLFVRASRFQIRAPSELITQTISYIFLGVFYGLSINDVELDYLGIASKAGILVMVVLEQMIIPMYIVANYLPNQLPITFREHWNGLYALVPSWLATLLVETLKMTILPFLFFPFVYYLGHFSGPTWRLFAHMLTLCLASNAGAACGSFLSYASSSVPMAIVNLMLLISPFMTFSGFFADDENLPLPFNYMRYTSMNFYALENTMAIQWEGVHKEDITDPKAQLAGFGDGEMILKFFKYQGSNYTRNCVLLLVISVVFRTMACIVLLLRGRR